MDKMEMIKWVNYVISLLFVLCYSYQSLYLFIPFILKDKKHKPVKLHRYAVLIAARNEEAVIDRLIESINEQDYPQELVDVYVVADNCTDDTAKVAAGEGAMVYERFDRIHVGKGYAMQYLLEKIAESGGEDFYDAYLVFDADNLLEKNYITEINKTFSDGYNIITSYRNSKNYGDNWISAGYSLWFLREAEYLNHARMLMHTSCAVSGTGYMFSREILKKQGGWNFFLLTEDIEFTISNIVKGEKIGYAKNAVFYDEQPVKFGQSCKQRMRWAKGNIQVFVKYFRELVKGIFIDGNFACFDMCMASVPAIIITMAGTIVNIAITAVDMIAGRNIMVNILSLGQMCISAYLTMFIVGLVATVSEWKNIHTTALKKLKYMFTFPVFMMTYIPISICAMFKKVEWKAIEHKVSVSLDEVKR